MTRWTLAAIIGFGVLMACGWALYLPIFQNPDEDSHYDYALTLFSAGRAVRPAENVLGRDTHPVVDYLMRETHARELRLDRNLRADSGYGSAAYFHALDAKAPHRLVVGSLDPAPYISRFYPIGYYALASLAIAAGDAISGHSVVAQFFAARFLSVLLLPFTLWFTWRALVELGIKRQKASSILACMALMPLTAWMAASVQPDVLVGALVAPITFVALKLRKDAENVRLLTILGFLLAALVATKQHYFLALYLPIAAMLLVRLSVTKRPLRALTYLSFVTVPATIALAFTEALLRAAPGGRGICQFPSGLSVAAHGGPMELARFCAVGLLQGMRDTFFDDGGLSFWLNYTAYRDTPIMVLSRPFTHVLASVIPVLSIVVATLVLLRLYTVASHLAVIGRRRSWQSAAKLATSNVLFNSYVAFIVIIYGFEASTGGEIPMQGRYWLPFMPAVWLAAFTVAPRALPRRLHRPFGNAALGLVLLFGLLASAYSFPSLRQRYYGPPRQVDPKTELTTAIWSDVARGSVRISGVAYDLRSAAPVERVVLRLDRRRAYVPAEVDRPDVQCQMEQTLLHVGYKLRLPAAALGAGKHTIAVFVKTPWRRDLIDTGTSTSFEIPEARSGVASHRTTSAG